MYHLFAAGEKLIEKIVVWALRNVAALQTELLAQWLHTPSSSLGKGKKKTFH